jgi:hypothetical protein
MMAVEAPSINLTDAIDQLRAERDLLRRLIETTGEADELVRRLVAVEDMLIGALIARRRRMREEDR